MPLGIKAECTSKEHVWDYDGSLEEIPEGAPCQCGQKILITCPCPTCERPWRMMDNNMRRKVDKTPYVQLLEQVAGAARTLMDRTKTVDPDRQVRDLHDALIRLDKMRMEGLNTNALV